MGDGVRPCPDMGEDSRHAPQGGCAQTLRWGGSWVCIYVFVYVHVPQVSLERGADGMTGARTVDASFSGSNL